MKLIRHAALLAVCAMTSCSTTQQVNFICDQTDVEIFVNDEYAGRNF